MISDSDLRDAENEVSTGCHSSERQTPATDGQGKSVQLTPRDQFVCRKFEGNTPNQEWNESTNRNP